MRSVLHSNRVLSARRASVLGVALFAAAGAVSVARDARAQADTNPALPNALLLVDTSGSMEYLAAGDSNGKPKLPTCTPGQPLLTNEQNRWTSLVSVLTGEVINYSCYPQSRFAATFQSEYQLSGVNPVDYKYYIPYNRIVSNNCVMGPNTAAWPPATGGGVFEFPANSFKGHKYDDPTIACNAFDQANDGLLDAFNDRVRFALMTFDSETSKKTGLSAPISANYADGVAGTWSYFPDWHTGGGTPAQGKPELCNFTSDIEVGARNPAAPPWEGKMIGFGDPKANGTQVATRNDQIQKVLLSVRPYGATPIAGMMSDARYFLTQDAFVDPTDSKAFGPKDDPYVTGGCRKNFIVLLTDGAPNLDLRPGCAANTVPPGGCPWEPGGVCPQGTCPYKKPSEIAYDLAHPADPTKAVLTFVVGFSVSTVGPNGPTQVDCSNLTPTGSAVFDPGGKCASVSPTDEALKACCELGRIAYNGGTQNPKFADNKDTLRKALNDIFSNIASKSTTRTLPVFATPATSGAGDAGYNFFTSFFVATGSLWNGVLERKRIQCDPQTLVPKELPVDPTKSDRFQDNVDTPDNSHPRYFYTVDPALLGGIAYGNRTIRGVPPGATAENPPGPPALGTDGLGTYGGVIVSGDATTFAASVSSQALQVAAGASSTCTNKLETLTPSQCRDRILKWDVGLDNGTIYSRKKSSTCPTCSAFGAIFHSTPQVVGPPTDFLRDESYITFQVEQKARPLVLYTATTDGQLHAFKVAKANAGDTYDPTAGGTNNELWSFMPPAVLPRLRSLYPGVQQNLLDGIPVVRDVILERTKSQARNVNAATGTGGARWSTILTAGFGSAFEGYYALDVTNPVRIPGDAKTGPKFLWQLATDVDGNKIFGRSVTPAIATVLLDVNGDRRETAVAILPGGDGDAANCAAPSGILSGDMLSMYNAGGGAVTPRGTLDRCYDGNNPALSLTIVRLDNGEVIKRFAPASVGSPLNASLLARTKATSFRAPVLGVPIAYPNAVGQVANRAFVGDKEGRVWRLDMSSPNPDNWEVKLFWDAFPASGTGTPSPVAAAGPIPVATQPALSIDPLGNLVLVFATGDQDNLAATPNLRNVAWSITEVPDLAAQKVTARLNWHLGFSETLQNSPGANSNWTNGIRITGPISVFNGVVYFSTFSPPSDANTVCALGDSTLWGVDYISAVSDAPRGRLLIDPAADKLNPPAAQNKPGTIIFGVGVTRVPTCFDTQSYDDPYLGNGSITSASNVNPGEFRLVVQTGPAGGTQGATQLTNTQTYSLPPPPTAARLGSWAALVE